MAENGVVIHYKFRQGNIVVMVNNLEFIKECVSKMSKGKSIKYAMRARKTKIVKSIPEKDWKQYKDVEIAETIHTMNYNKTAFRLIVIKKGKQMECIWE